MKKKMDKENKLLEALAKGMANIVNIIDMDKKLYGDAFVEITNRKIEVIEPTKLKSIKGEDKSVMVI